MNRESQDRLWNSLNEDSKREKRELYFKVKTGQIAMSLDEARGYCKGMENVFGAHNLNEEEDLSNDEMEMPRIMFARLAETIQEVYDEFPEMTVFTVVEAVTYILSNILMEASDKGSALQVLKEVNHHIESRINEEFKMRKGGITQN